MRAQDIVTKSRTWIGTTFHHQERVKGVGCDCLGLLVGVAKELDLKCRNGSRLWLHDEVTYQKNPNGQYLVEKIKGLLNQVAEPKFGDIGLFKIEESPQHLAILSDFGDELGMIHAYLPAKKVIEHRLDDYWRSKLAYIRPSAKQLKRDKKAILSNNVWTKKSGYMSLNYEKLKMQPYNFLQLTGLNVTEFDKIIGKIKVDWLKLEDRKKSHGRTSHLPSLEDKVLCAMIFYRTYITHSFLGYLFNLHNSNICRLLKKIEPLLSKKITKERS